MTRPHTCGSEGGAISLWVRVINCDYDGSLGGIVTTRSQLNSAGFFITCADSRIM